MRTVKIVVGAAMGLALPAALPVWPASAQEPSCAAGSHNDFNGDFISDVVVGAPDATVSVTRRPDTSTFTTVR